jgi:hypothetical protein
MSIRKKAGASEQANDGGGLTGLIDLVKEWAMEALAGCTGETDDED